MESQLINVVRQLILENNHVSHDQPISLSFSINKQLGLDSLGRAELFTRIEKEFNVQLRDEVMRQAETLQDIVMALKNDTTATPYFTTHQLASSTECSDPSHVTTLCDLLKLHAKTMPDRVHMYIHSEEKKPIMMTYHDLYIQSQYVASYLIKKGLQKSDTVAIMLPTSEHFFYSFFGVLLAGGIPVPIYPPVQISQLENYIKKETHVLSNAMVRYLITFSKATFVGHSLKSFVPTLRTIVTVDVLLKKNLAVSSIDTNTQGNDVALIQYTSGSTNHPKGVVLTHYNILSNIRAYGEAIKINSNDVCISWLPLYHDLGLIGNWLGSLYFGVPLVVFSPIDFLNRPERWLQAIHHYRGTISAAPNFAYELCVNKLKSEQLENLDLSSWRIAVNGAEIIQPETLNRFYEKFSQFGLKKETLLPVYGLAENSLGLTATPLNRGPRIDKIDRDIFERKQQAIPSESEFHLQFVFCGKVLPNHQIRIVNEEEEVLPERYVGNIQFRGPSSMQGYWNDTHATSLVYHDGWWDTGDLGYMADGEIVITGRKKDIIIKAGRNYIAADIENAVAAVSGIRRGCVVAFSVNHVERKKEELIVIAETSKVEKNLLHEINNKINEAINIFADEIILVPPKTIPKTSSGKLQRSACKKKYLDNTLMRKPSRLSVQIGKLVFKNTFNKTLRFLKFGRRLFQTMYVGMWVLGTFPFLYFLVLFASKKVSRQIVGSWFRMLFFVNFVPVKVQGKENAAKFSQQIFIANHSSYMDIVFLLAVLPRNITIICKKSLLKIPVLKTFIKKLDYLPIEKYDQNQAVDDVLLIRERLDKHESILLFPEGAFNNTKGLRAFKMGAFKLAVETKIPITPVITQGLREFLPRKAWLFKFNPLKVVIAQPLITCEAGWQGMVSLKHEAYSVILDKCGEPRLDFTSNMYKKFNSL